MIDNAFQNALSAIVSPVQVYWGTPQQTSVLPYCTFLTISTQAGFLLTQEYPLSKYMIQVDVWASNLADAQNITTIIGSSLDRAIDLAWNGGITVSTFLENRMGFPPVPAEIGTSGRYYRIMSEYKIIASVDE